MCITVAYLIQRHALQVPRGIALLILVQELLVVAQELVADGRGLVVGCIVAHVGEDAACKVDVAAPSVGLIVALVTHQPTALDDFPIQAKDVQRRVVAAAIHHVLPFCV